MKLKYSRASFSHLTCSDLVKCFEEGNMDYSIFKDAGIIDLLVGAYEITQMDQHISESPKPEDISHIAALICAGWCQKPSESPYWRERSKNTNGSSEGLLPGRRTNASGTATSRSGRPAYGNLVEGIDDPSTIRQIHARFLTCCQCALCEPGLLQPSASSESLSSTIYTPATTIAETTDENWRGGISKPALSTGTRGHNAHPWNTSTASTLRNTKPSALMRHDKEWLESARGTW